MNSRFFLHLFTIFLLFLTSGKEHVIITLQSSWHKLYMIFRVNIIYYIQSNEIQKNID